jgi:tetratricopeptide (TPR) repeat protein
MDLAEAKKLIEADPIAAAARAQEALALNPADVGAYGILGTSLRRLGLHEEASRAELSAIEASGKDPDLIRATRALKARDYATAELVLKGVLESRPNDVLAIQTLGEVAAAAGLLYDAEALHRRALELAPAFEYSRLHLANVLNNQGRPGEALSELRKTQGEMLDFKGYKMLLADVLGQIGESDEAIDLYRSILASDPGMRDIWSRLSFLLNSVGRRDEAIEACRTALRTWPGRGHAWWSLADLKTYHFTDEDIAAMERVLADPKIGTEDRMQIHFALGKAFEDRKDSQSSFDHYSRGNALRKGALKYNSGWGAALLARRQRRSFARSDFHCRHATIRIDPGRTNPRQSSVD